MDIRNALIYIKHQATRGRNKPRLKKELLVDLEIIEKHATEALIEAEKKFMARENPSLKQLGMQMS